MDKAAKPPTPTKSGTDQKQEKKEPEYIKGTIEPTTKK